ncbi:unnamed protein product [Triticum turgidum subsp. durum]|uniref:Uncharacterized protein n=1 Tax=Triticum turgidum subsp. durum TaxID=4567 RepID=A0A9R1ADG2_TRITD|nr:unnamed protein product [Triticum turgidum subsp. durum]
MRRSTRVKDEEGYPAFALVNKATGLAIKHSLGQSHPVDLVPYEYDPAVMDLSVLWTQSRDVGDGFRCIRMVSNIYLNFDAFEGEPELQDGTIVGLWEWNEGGNQCWKILPWGTDADAPPPAAADGDDDQYGGYHGGQDQETTRFSYGGDDAAPQDQGQGYDGGLPPALSSECTVRIFCSAGGEDYSVAARDGTVCLAPTDPGDDSQLGEGHAAQHQHQGRGWVPCVRPGEQAHRRSHQAFPWREPPCKLITCSPLLNFLIMFLQLQYCKLRMCNTVPQVRLVRYDPNYLDESVLWTESEDVGDGFRCVRMVNNIRLNFDALDAGEGQSGVHDGTAIVLWEWCEGENQRWKILPWCE